MSIYKMRTEMGHYFKWLLLLVVVPIFIIGGVNYFGGSGPGPDRGEEGASDAIATVNGSPITRAEFEQTWEQVTDEARQRGVRSPLQYADMRMGIFQQLVNNRMMLAAAERLGLDITDKAVDEQVEKMITMYLKENRRAVLGKISPQKEATDPREDDQYISELERGGMSLKQQIGIAESRIPREQVRAQMAQMAIEQQLMSRAKPVTDRDIMASYNVYKIRQVVLQPGGLPKAQVMTRAAKVQSAASAGQDFAKLATDNTSDPAGKRTGGAAEFSFETRFMLPQSVRDAIQKMSPGQVSKVLDTPQGIYIVKLESVQARVPAKLDDKAKKARKDELTQDRQMVVAAEFREQLQRGQKVEVSDPEFLAYWQLMGAMSAGSDPQEYGKQMKLAISSLRKASGGRANNYVHIQLARLLDRDGQTAEAVRILYPMLEGKDASVEGADLRILLGDMLMKTGAKGDKERALAQYQEAGEVAPHDPEIHQQLLGKFKELKRPDLVAKEEAWMADFLQRMAQMQEMRKKQAPAPGKAPSAPPAR